MPNRGLRVLTFTSLFPNAIAPNLGGFIARRMQAWATRHGGKWSVVAPVPFFPPFPGPSRWSAYARVPREERLEGKWRIAHPRYLMLPKVGLRVQGPSMARFCRRVLARVWREDGPFDLIDAHFVYPDGFAAVHLARWMGVPCVVSARGTDINLYPDLPGIRRKIRATLQGAAAVVGVSPPLVNRMVTLGAPRDRCSVIPNGVDLERFFPVAREPRLVKRLVAVGNLVRVKGFDILLDALATIPEGPEPLTLRIIGAGSEEQELRARAMGLGLASRVRFEGALPHQALPAVYRDADALCLASRREGCPNVVLEALASGLPVCATPVGGVPDLVRDGANGVLASEVSAEGMAAALVRLRAQLWEPESIRASVGEMSWSSVADRLQSIFSVARGESCLARGRNP